MLDIKPKHRIDWDSLFQHVRTGQPFLLGLDYLEETRRFLVAGYEAVQQETVELMCDLAKEQVRVYCASSAEVPSNLPDCLKLERDWSLGLHQSPSYIEAALQLMKWAGCQPMVMIAELEHEQPIASVEKSLTVKDVVSRMMDDQPVREISSRVTIPTKWGDFDMIGFTDAYGGTHTALVCGELNTNEPVLLRVHSECFTGDIFGSGRCDCGEQLDFAMRTIREHGSGVVLYMRQEGRGIGLLNKFNAYMLQDAGFDTVEANHMLGFPGDARDYTTAIQMLRHLGLRKVAMITNNPRKLKWLDEAGIEIVERVPVQVHPDRHNKRYLATKSRKLGHRLEHLNLTAEQGEVSHERL